MADLDDVMKEANRETTIDEWEVGCQDQKQCDVDFLNNRAQRLRENGDFDGARACEEAARDIQAGVSDAQRKERNRG